MGPRYAVWISLFIIAALLVIAAKYSACFPGDVAVERGVQSLLSQNLNWAEGVSKTPEFPQVLVILALIFVFSWLLAGWRAALLSIFSFAGMWAMGKWLAPS
jgi:hypothetical protein